MFSNHRRIACLLTLCFLLPLWSAEEGEEKKTEEKKWDVAHFTDETYEIEIDTDEGTWMNLDLSPDGKLIAFDLLGDIYTLPIEGGEATQIAAGLPWEMQPRFSPDGKRIAFTSDRAGGDNLWTMAPDGSDPIQVSKESFRLINSPAWSPDGNFIAGHKHFSSARSLGSGEIWLYHRGGGTKGIQLNEKPNEQKDLGEPAFSPDGRYVYFSQDVTPGGTFEYSKDPSPGIYAIKRIDLEEGDIETIISGNGGAVRPTPSPNGRSLAFVRRHNYTTVLFVHDLESGANTPVYDKLDRDLQETWAVHGVYPTMAWTSDSKALIFWAGGKIHRLDLASKSDTIIPFHVKTSRTMVTALRHPVTVAPDRFETQMLRWVAVSPKGDKVVFCALGHLYLRDLPNGTARRLTQQNDHFEYYPSFSSDGGSIVYVSWDDEQLGAVRTLPVTGGPSKVITRTKGHFIEPAFSPDGKTIVYSKIGGGYITSPLYSAEPGIYKVPAAGGESKRISRRGSQPHFGSDNGRMYFVTVDKESERTLRSVNLDGFDEREHVKSGMGVAFRVSPKGNWLAYREGWNAYITPFPLTGKKYAIGDSSTPSAKVSADAGEHLHWSGDGTRLYWHMGNRLFHRDLKDAFSFLEGAPEKLPEPDSEGLALGFEVTADKPSGKWALTGARLVTMKGDQVIEDGVIVIEDNRIAAIGPRGEVTIPGGANVIDVAGKTIIPGLVDVHAHGPQGNAEMIPEQNWSSYAGLTFGVTTIHDPSHDTSTIFAASEMARAGLILAPRIFSTGTILYGATEPSVTSKVDSLEDAQHHVRRLKAAGAFSVKSYNQPRREQRQQIITAARQENMMVVPEGGSLFQHNMSMIADGHTGVEHCIPLADIYKDVVSFWSQSQTGYTPTLVVAYGGISGENYWYQHDDVWKHKRLSKFVPPYLLEARARRRVKAPESEYNHIKVAAHCKKLLDAGVSVQLGAHGQREGLAAHWEMWMLGQGGMTPMEVLRCATMNGAHYLGLDGDIGSLEVGKLADLAVLDRNPLENIRNTDSVRYVVLNGRIFEAESMNEIGNHPRGRMPFFFESGAGAFPNNLVTAESHALSGDQCGDRD